MEIVGLVKLEKLRRKNFGNTRLSLAIDKLTVELNSEHISNPAELRIIRHDADLVHADGFYMFNIYVHRVLILIEFAFEGEATVIWCGSHDEYKTNFKNNKTTIIKWLKAHGFIK